MINRSELRADSRKSLEGKYGECVKLILVYCLIVFAVGFGCGLLNNLTGGNENTYNLIEELISVVLSGLFGFGMINFFLKISRGEEVSYKELFSKTNLILPYLGITIVSSIFVCLWSILFIIPGIIASIAYSMAYLVYLDNPELGVMGSIKESKEMMKGYKWEYFKLIFSFFGWMLLGICTLGILYLWLIPYINVCECKFYDYIKSKK